MSSDKPFTIGYLPMTGDLPHLGHYYAICKAQEYCQHLLVGLLSDDAVERYKGHKPIIKYWHRKLMLNYMYHSAIIGEQQDIDPSRELESNHVEAMFSGDGFTPEEESAAKKLGIHLINIDYWTGDSTSKIKQRVIDQYESTKSKNK